MVDPLTGWTIVKTAAEAGKKLYEVAKGVKDYETKQKLNEILDQLNDLKQQASELEDENRELREKLRFKDESYEFVNPFYYDRAKDPKHETPFCPKCFVAQKTAPMSKPYQSGNDLYRRCLACGTPIEVEHRPRQHEYFSPSGEWS